ncbi:hypothetical protein [Corynebacterium stationis]|uniref:DUF732 domain-containing protein n=1 Tax=Corynebacterium stationis TaxID=1705 RepID=A0AB36CJF0_9CORY|nr:hypothetical protein [Corynebacterium stationis]NME88933.1 hypothetical protein [Corynebacterium stationis]
MKRLIPGAAALLAAFTLAACGSATVESGSEISPDDTIAPLERGEGELTSAPETSSSKAAAASSEASTSASEPAPEDRGAQEVEKAPTPQVDNSDAGYLDAIAGSGVDISGVENQLISAAHTACNPDDEVTVLAVAGQLVEQERTDKDVEEVATLINEHAQAAYC